MVVLRISKVSFLCSGCVKTEAPQTKHKDGIRAHESWWHLLYNPRGKLFADDAIRTCRVSSQQSTEVIESCPIREFDREKQACFALPLSKAAWTAAFQTV